MLSCGLLLACGCRKPASTATQPALLQPDYANGATVTGTIHASGKFPAPVLIDMGQDPACDLSSTTPNMSEQYAVHDGAMANVYLYIKQGLGDSKYAVPATPVRLDQKGCRYVPHVVAVMAGQTLLVSNSDMTMHNVHPLPQEAANHASDMTEAPGSKPMAMSYAAPEQMVPVRCNNHPWMEAFLNVAPSPFYAVSDSTGKYAIHGLPPGTYTLAAVQEKLGEQDQTITVPAHGTATADFTFAAK